MKNRLNAAVLTTAVTLTAIVSVAASQTVVSRWKDREITTDGLITEWTELTTFPENVSVAAYNDEHDLYLAVATSDPQRQHQLLGTGFVVWLDAAGGRKEQFGIRIPGGEMPRRGGRGEADSERPAEAQFDQPYLTYVELLGPEKDDRRRLELVASASTGIAIGAHIETGTLLYELKIPIVSAAEPSSQSYGVTAKADHALGLGLLTPEAEQQPGAVPAHGGGTGGMSGRGRGGMGGGRYGGGQADMRGRGLEALKLWTTLTLARAPR